MISSSKFKSVDFYRKIPRDLTEASLSGAGLSIIAALCMVFLFGMELNHYLAVSTSTSVIVDKSSDGEFLRIDFNISFPALSCEFASVDVSDILGTNRLNITKTIRKYSIDSHLRPTGSEFHSDPIPMVNNHGDETEEEYSDGSALITSSNFESYSHRHAIMVVNFYAPWCYWSNRLKPSWEKTAKTIRERYDPEMDGRILLGKVDCTQDGDLCRRYFPCQFTCLQHVFHAKCRMTRYSMDLSARNDLSFYLFLINKSCPWSGLTVNSWPSCVLCLEMTFILVCVLCFVFSVLVSISFLRVEQNRLIGVLRRHHIQGYPSIRIFRKGSDIRDNHGHHDHESYYGERDTESLVAAMETLVASVPKESRMLAVEDKSAKSADAAKRPAPMTSGCRIEGFVRVKKVPGNLVISAHSGSHSFDASLINVSHVISHFSFGKRLSSKMLTEAKRLLPYVGASHDRLTGQSYIIGRDDTNANVTIEHYLQVVKTELVSSRYYQEFKLLEEYEYTAHSSLVHSLDIPVAKFHFEPSAMQVLVSEVPKSFSHFITNVCAIIGGVFTVAGILDSILHNTIRFAKKVELGKHI